VESCGGSVSAEVLVEPAAIGNVRAAPIAKDVYGSNVGNEGSGERRDTEHRSQKIEARTLRRSSRTGRGNMTRFARRELTETSKQKSKPEKLYLHGAKELEIR